jgi:hypothetical protein
MRISGDAIPTSCSMSIALLRASLRETFWWSVMTSMIWLPTV